MNGEAVSAKAPSKPHRFTYRNFLDKINRSKKFNRQQISPLILFVFCKIFYLLKIFQTIQSSRDSWSFLSLMNYLKPVYIEQSLQKNYASTVMLFALGKILGLNSKKQNFCSLGKKYLMLDSTMLCFVKVGQIVRKVIHEQFTNF